MLSLLSVDMSSFLPVSVSVPLFWPRVEFSLFLIGQILSICCYLFVFYCILFDRAGRQSPRNDSILILLFYNFFNVVIDLSLTQDFTRRGDVLLFHPTVCLICQYIDYGIWYGGLSMMLWISLERHLFVFHSTVLGSVRRRVLFLYMPLGVSALYAPTLFFYLIFVLPCDRTYIPTRVRCGSVCFYSVIPYWFNLYDSLVNYTSPIVLIFVLSVAFLLRFFKQKQRLKATVTWRRCRKMVVQLVLVSVTYLLFDMPFLIVSLVRKLGYPTFASNALSPYITRLTFVPAILLPFAPTFGLTDTKRKLQKMYFWRGFPRNVVSVHPH